MTEKVISKTDFRIMTAYEKGYYCYAHGDRKEQPNIPRSFQYKARASIKAYKSGQFSAMLAAQDSP